MVTTMGDERERATMSAKAKRRTRAERACEGVMREKSKREEKDDYDEEKQEKRSQKIEKMRKKYLITSLFPFLSLSLTLTDILLSSHVSHSLILFALLLHLCSLSPHFLLCTLDSLFPSLFSRFFFMLSFLSSFPISALMALFLLHLLLLLLNV